MLQCDTIVGYDFQLNPGEDVALSFLPLAHVYGRTLDYFISWRRFALAYVETVEAVAQALLEVRPTLTAAVPRFFEKIYARLVEQGSKNTGVKRMIFDWAMRVAEMSTQWRANQTQPSLAITLQWKLPTHWFTGKSAWVWVGVSALSVPAALRFPRISRSFSGPWEFPIYQGYGLTETSPIVSSNYPNNRMGSSGKPIPNVQVRTAEDGEILVKGPCIMQGYYKNPEATREVLTEDGWFSTGDIGYVDKDNYLFITDRKKDLLKTAAGKFVAPQPIENALKTSPYISNAMVVGDKQKFIVALIVPNAATVRPKPPSRESSSLPTPS